MSLWQEIQDSATAFAQKKKRELVGSSPTSNGKPSLGGSLWNQIVQSTQSAAVKVFRNTDTGKGLEAEATQQKVNEILSNPLTWIALGAAILLIGFLARKV